MVDYVLHATRLLQFDYCNSIVALYKLYCKSGCLSCLNKYRRTVQVQRASQLVSDLWPNVNAFSCGPRVPVLNPAYCFAFRPCVYLGEPDFG